MALGLALGHDLRGALGGLAPVDGLALGRRGGRFASTRFLRAFMDGSRSFRSTTSGVAMKIEEYAPAARPTNSDSEMSLSMPAPRKPPPMKSRAPTGSSATTVVLIERTNVPLMLRLATSLKV